MHGMSPKREHHHICARTQIRKQKDAHLLSLSLSLSLKHTQSLSHTSATPATMQRSGQTLVEGSAQIRQQHFG